MRDALAADPAAIKDAVQVRLLAAALARLDRDAGLAPLFAAAAAPEVLAEQGWILGVGHQAALKQAALASADPSR